MIARGSLSALPRLFSACVLAAAALAGCKDKQEPPPAPPAPPKVEKPAEPVVTLDQATAALLALPEVKEWSRDIEKRSHGKAHGAIIEDDPKPRTLNGRQYWQLSFVENRADRVLRRESFLVAQTGNDILVEDAENDTVMSLDDWRRGVHKIRLKSAD